MILKNVELIVTTSLNIFIPVVRGAKFGTFYIVIRKLEFSISGILDCINKTGIRDSTRKIFWVSRVKIPEIPSPNYIPPTNKGYANLVNVSSRQNAYNNAYK